MVGQKQETPCYLLWWLKGDKFWHLTTVSHAWERQTLCEPTSVLILLIFEKCLAFMGFWHPFSYYWPWIVRHLPTAKVFTAVKQKRREMFFSSQEFHQNKHKNAAKQPECWYFGPWETNTLWDRVLSFFNIKVQMCNVMHTPHHKHQQGLSHFLFVRLHSALTRQPRSACIPLSILWFTFTRHIDLYLSLLQNGSQCSHFWHIREIADITVQHK